MSTIATTYLGLALPSPVIVSSSSLTNSVNGITRAAEAGAGAVVVKSLFEEQIDAEFARDAMAVDLSQHPEAAEYVGSMSKHHGPADYLRLLESAKRSVEIPIIASVNCVSPEWWTNYGSQIATTGIDALELNVAIMPRSGEPADEIENRYVETVASIASRIDIPIAVKIGPYFTSLPLIAARLRDAGAKSLVLFNRFYQVDVDIDSESITSGYQLSAPEEIPTTLRWTSILSGSIGVEIAASTAIYTGSDAIKMILAGAQVTYLCSTIYKNGYPRISEVNSEIEAWMSYKGYDSIESFRGKLRQSSSESPERYERLQYIKALTSAN